jgi:hypothetical protein
LTAVSDQCGQSWQIFGAQQLLGCPANYWHQRSLPCAERAVTDIRVFPSTPLISSDVKDSGETEALSFAA